MKRCRRAFTLIELLVVIGIIGLLVVIALSIGARVTGTGKQRLTESVIQILDGSIQQYQSERGSIPSPTFKHENPAQPGQHTIVPVADAAWDGANGAMINSVGWYVLQAGRESGVGGLFTGVDARLLENFEIDNPPTGAGWPSDNPQMPTLMDAWGRPLRYVHPAFDGLIHGPNFKAGSVTAGGAGASVLMTDILGAAPGGLSYAFPQIRRNNLPTGSVGPDSDGGVCPGNSPYFYSTGADGNPATTDDNVYSGSTKPKFQKAM